jgi:hypothetical protein
MEEYIKNIWEFFKRDKKESFCLFFLQDNTLSHEKVSKNETINSCEIDLKKLANLYEKLNGKEVIAVHNHPTSDPTPSYPDFFQKKYTESLLNLIGATMSDYGIVSPYGFLSFKDAKLLESRENIQPIKQHEFDEVKLPALLLSSDIEKYKDSIVNKLNTYPEIIYNNNEQYGSFLLPGDLLVEKSGNFMSKCLFFYNEKSDTLNLDRLNDINIVFEPFEIYLLDKENLIPLKKAGIL